VFQCVAVCCSVTFASASMRRFICVAVCCSVLQCVAVSRSPPRQRGALYVLQCVAVCCRVLQCHVRLRVNEALYMCCSVLQCAAVSMRALHMCRIRYFMCGMTFVRRFICVAVCCVLQCVATHSSAPLRHCRYVRHRLVEGTFVLCRTCV